MTQLATAASPRKGDVDPLHVLYERASTRAYLWFIGEYELPEAVDALQAYAVRHQLVQRVGQDAVQTILADAFRPYRGACNG